MSATAISRIDQHLLNFAVHTTQPGVFVRHLPSPVQRRRTASTTFADVNEPALEAAKKKKEKKRSGAADAAGAFSQFSVRARQRRQFFLLLVPVIRVEKLTNLNRASGVWRATLKCKPFAENTTRCCERKSPRCASSSIRHAIVKPATRFKHQVPCLGMRGTSPQWDRLAAA